VQLILQTGVYFAPLKVSLSLAGLLFVGFLFTLDQDIFIRQDLTEQTLLFLVAIIRTGIFALSAGMIDKCTNRF
jgi:hypothetical protein